MSTLRLLLRLAALALVTTGWLALLLLGLPFARLAGRTWAWRAAVQQRWSRSLCAILGLRLEVQGVVPQGPFLLVANHLSYVDVLVLGSLAPCSFVAKAEIAGWPLVGFLARVVGTEFVAREKHRELNALNERLRARLARGEALVLFPEGTSTAGQGVLRFRPALLAPAAALALPVRYAALRYATPPGAPAAELAVCWWGEMTFVAHFLGLLRLPHIAARVVFGPEPIAASDRKDLAVRLQRAVEERLEPLLNHA